MIVDEHARPEKSPYFIGAQILNVLGRHDREWLSPSIVFEHVRYIVPVVGSGSYAHFLIGLDWLFLVGAIEANPKGEIRRCS